MKTIKINFVDFWSKFDKNNNTIINILKERYNVIISDDPDFLFYSVFGNEYIKYDCIKIFYSGECITPDFNLCDYAIAFEEMTYGDRYIRVPLYELFNYRQKYEYLINNKIERVKKNAFCSFVVSNDQGSEKRFQIFQLLNKYKKVNSGGRYMNNIGTPINDKLGFDRNHKFSICFENCSHPGYTTEKIMEAFAADTIPIYWGNPNIGNEFNTHAFVNANDYETLEDVVTRIIEIDQNNDIYESMKKERILSNARTSLNELQDFLYHIFDQDLNIARRRPINTYITRREKEVKVFNIYFKLIGKKINKIKAAIRRFRNNAL